MSLERGFSVGLPDLRLNGYTLAGVTTSIGLPDLSLLFDVGQGLPFQTAYNHIFVSHTHMDHASGIPYLISQKSMQRRPRPIFYMPESAIGPFNELMKLWHRLDQFEYEFTFLPAKPKTAIQIGSDIEIIPFQTFHRVESLGYSVVKKKRSLKDEYRNKSSNELAMLRKQNVAIEEIKENVLFSYTGDTKIDFFEDELVQRSEYLALEVTYWDHQKSLENTHHWGHTHFEEILQILPRFRGKKLILLHASARYKTAELLELINSRVPENLKDKLLLFPRSI